MAEDAPPVACARCAGSGLVEPTPAERILLERELMKRYGYLVSDPLQRPCDCNRIIERALMSSELRMLLSAWRAVRELDAKP